MKHTSFLHTHRDHEPNTVHIQSTTIATECVQSLSIKEAISAFLVMFVLLILFSNQAYSQGFTKQTTYYKTLDSLLNCKAYFKARDYFTLNKKYLTEPEQLMAGARINNLFNRILESNTQIKLLLKKYNHLLSDSLKCVFMEEELTNLARMGEYKEAFEVNDQLLKKYKGFLLPDEIEDYQTTRIIWQSLKSQPKQTIIKKSNTRLPIYRDNAGLANLKVSVDADTSHFIFDTGANISVVTESMAQTFGIHLMDSFIYVKAFTGIQVKSKIGVCELLTLGNIEIHNAYFLIFPDSALAVPQIKLQINGIIGFPIIEALQEIQITQSGEFIVPKITSTASEQNMALQFLTPILCLGGDSYFFDTGAQSSILFNTYYQKHKRAIDSTYQETDLNFGSAGGLVLKRGFNIRFTSQINQKEFIIPSVMLLKDMIKPDDEHIYGNIGQDLIKQFGRMTINFKDMFIKFD